jgi:hypothetical protein
MPGLGWSGFLDDDGLVVYVYSQTVPGARDLAEQLARGHA